MSQVRRLFLSFCLSGLFTQNIKIIYRYTILMLYIHSHNVTFKWQIKKCPPFPCCSLLQKQWTMFFSCKDALSTSLFHVKLDCKNPLSCNIFSSCSLPRYFWHAQNVFICALVMLLYNTYHCISLTGSFAPFLKIILLDLWQVWCHETFSFFNKTRIQT